MVVDRGPGARSGVSPNLLVVVVVVVVVAVDTSPRIFQMQKGVTCCARDPCAVVRYGAHD
jgi:hypothetical protein